MTGGLVMNGWLFKYIHFVWLETLNMLGNDPWRLKNSINAFLMNQSIILYYFYSLNVYGYPDYHQHFSYTYPFSPVCFISSFEKSS